VTRERDEPKPLRDALAEVTADLGLPEPDAFRTLVANWEQLVGEDLSTHCRLRSLRDGVLRLGVDSAPRATQLRYLEGEVIDRAAGLVGADVVRSVRIAVDP
jgi:predicted nucleic acid-binding Zn ribbon protein